MTAPTIEEIIAEIKQNGCKNGAFIVASLEKLQSIEPQPVPVEPVARYEGVEMSRYTISWLNSPPLNLSNLHTIYDESNPWPHIPVGTKLYSQSAIDSLQSALRVAQEERDASIEEHLWKREQLTTAFISERDSLVERAEKAEATNRRMVELLENPSTAILNHFAGTDFMKLSPSKQVAEICDFNAMSAELLKEVEK